MTDTLYRKRGRRYEPVGRDIDGPMPTASLPLLVYKPEVVYQVMERARKRGTWSPESIIGDTLSVLAELAEPKVTV